MNRGPYAVLTESEIVAALARELGAAQFALLFGSFGKPHFNDQSDLDVAVQLSEPLDLSGRLRLAAALETAAGRDVDLVDLRAADPVLAFQILSYGRPLVMSDSKAYHRFVVSVLSEYADLKLDRRPIEEALVQGGGR